MSTREFLKEVGLFSGLADPHLERLAALARPETVRRGEFVFRERDAATRLYAVVNGVVEIGRMKDGRLIRLARLERGEVFGEVSLFEESPHTVAAQASVAPETHLLAWDLPAVRDLLASEPALSNALLRAVVVKLSQRLRGMSEALFTLLRALDGPR